MGVGVNRIGKVCSNICQIEEQCLLTVVTNVDPEILIPRGPPVCDKDNKPKSPTFQYTGGSCAASNNDQGDKSTCTGSIDDDSPVDVTTSNRKISKIFTVTPSTVNPNDEFTISVGDKFEFDTLINLIQPNQTETNKVHTSC